MINKNSLLNLLDEYNIKYILYEHPPLFSVEDSKKLRGDIEGAHTKNLFLKNKKNNFFLFTCLESSKVDLKILKNKLELGNISFAGEKYLIELLNLKPGSVSPFGLLNDRDKKIQFFIDAALDNFETFNFHPLINTATINISKNDFYNFFKINKININLINFRNYDTRTIK